MHARWSGGSYAIGSDDGEEGRDRDVDVDVDVDNARDGLDDMICTNGIIEEEDIGRTET